MGLLGQIENINPRVKDQSVAFAVCQMNVRLPSRPDRPLCQGCCQAFRFMGGMGKEGVLGTATSNSLSPKLVSFLTGKPFDDRV